MHGVHDLKDEYHNQIVRLPPQYVNCSSSDRRGLSRSQSSVLYRRVKLQRRFFWTVTVLFAIAFMSCFIGVIFYLGRVVLQPALQVAILPQEPKHANSEPFPRHVIITKTSDLPSAIKYRDSQLEKFVIVVYDGELGAGQLPESTFSLSTPAHSIFEALTFSFCKYYTEAHNIPSSITWILNDPKEMAQVRWFTKTTKFPKAMISIVGDRSGQALLPEIVTDPFDCKDGNPDTLNQRAAVALACPVMEPYLNACVMSQNDGKATKFVPPWAFNNKEV